MILHTHFYKYIYINHIYSNEMKYKSVKFLTCEIPMQVIQGRGPGRRTTCMLITRQVITRQNRKRFFFIFTHWKNSNFCCCTKLIFLVAMYVSICCCNQRKFTVQWNLNWFWLKIIYYVVNSNNGFTEYWRKKIVY